MMSVLGRSLLPIAIAMLVLLVASTAPVAAQSLSIDLGDEGGSATGRIVQLIALMTVLSLAPSILVMVTSFTRIVVVLSFVRTALGTQQTPPNQVLVSLALFVMMPTLERSYDQGIRPLIEGEIDEMEAFDRSVEPVREFMLYHVREQDLVLFMDMAAANDAANEDVASNDAGVAGNTGNDVLGISAAAADDEVSVESPPLRALIPAFMVSELRRAFEIGFLIFVPFLIIDMVVASVLMSMGMMMLPPIIIALPFKIIFFVLVDGWHLVVGSLVRSFGG